MPARSLLPVSYPGLPKSKIGLIWISQEALGIRERKKEPPVGQSVSSWTICADKSNSASMPNGIVSTDNSGPK